MTCTFCTGSRFLSDTPALGPCVCASTAMTIRSDVVAQVTGSVVDVNPFTAYRPAPGVVPDDAKPMAMDDACGAAGAWSGYGIAYNEGLAFMGYPYLAELTQRPEYRRITEILARDMTRRWIRLTSAGTTPGATDEEKSAKLAELDKAIKRHKLPAVFRTVAELDGFFGRGHLFVDVAPPGGKRVKAGELKTPLAIDDVKITRGSLRGFRPVEPIWTYPNQYNSTDPLSPTYYQPQNWFVMGELVHSSRLQTFVSREVPDILKPAYSFGGLSMSQMAKPYIDNWIRTRASVSEAVHTYSVSTLATNMGAVLQGGGAESLIARAQMFNQFRDNRNLMIYDKETEEFANVSSPLTDLADLQAASQEHMASVSGIPLVVLLGVTPSGLNASSDGEIAVYNVGVNALQEHLFRDNLTRCIQIVQLDLWGAIDPDIDFEFVELGDTDPLEAATIRKTNAEADMIYTDGGVLSAEEIRLKLAADSDSPYHSIDLSDPPPEPPEVTLAGPEDDQDLPAPASDPPEPPRAGA